MRTRGLYSVRRRLGSDIVRCIKAAVAQPGFTVLEIGCGAGNALVELKAPMSELRAIGLNFRPDDAQRSELEHVYAECGHRIPLRYHSADYVGSIVTLHSTRNRAKAVEVISRVPNVVGEARFDLRKCCRPDGMPVNMDVVLRWRLEINLPGHKKKQHRKMLLGVERKYVVMRRSKGLKRFSNRLECIPRAGMTRPMGRNANAHVRSFDRAATQKSS